MDEEERKRRLKEQEELRLQALRNEREAILETHSRANDELGAQPTRTYLSAAQEENVWRNHFMPRVEDTPSKDLTIKERTEKVNKKFDDWYTQRQTELEAGRIKQAGETGPFSWAIHGSADFIGKTMGFVWGLGDKYTYTSEKIKQLGDMTRAIEEGIYVAAKKEGMINDEINAIQTVRRYGRLGIGAIEQIMGYTFGAAQDVTSVGANILKPGKIAEDDEPWLNHDFEKVEDWENLPIEEKALYNYARILSGAEIERDILGRITAVDPRARGAGNYIKDAANLANTIADEGGSEWEATLAAGLGKPIITVFDMTIPYDIALTARGGAAIANTTMKRATYLKNKRVITNQFREAAKEAGTVLSKNDASEMVGRILKTRDPKLAEEMFNESMLRILPEDSEWALRIQNAEQTKAIKAALTNETLIRQAEKFDDVNDFITAVREQMTRDRANMAATIRTIEADVFTAPGYSDAVKRFNEIATQYGNPNTGLLNVDTPTDILTEYHELADSIIKAEDALSPFDTYKVLISDNVPLGEGALDATYGLLKTPADSVDSVLTKAFETSKNRQATVLKNVDAAPRAVDELPDDEIMDMMAGLRKSLDETKALVGRAPSDIDALNRYIASDAAARGIDARAPIFAQASKDQVQRTLKKRSKDVKKYDLPASQFVRRVNFTEGDTLLAALGDATKYKSFDSFVKNSEHVVYRGPDNVTYVRSKALAKQYAEAEGTEVRPPMVLDMKRPLDLRHPEDVALVVERYGIKDVVEGELTMAQAQQILNIMYKTGGRDGVIFKVAGQKTVGRIVADPNKQVIPAIEFYKAIEKGNKTGDWTFVYRRRMENKTPDLMTNAAVENFDFSLKTFKVAPKTKDAIKKTLLYTIFEDRLDAGMKTTRGAKFKGYRRAILNDAGNETGYTLIITEDEISILKESTKQRNRIAKGADVKKLIDDVTVDFKKTTKERLAKLENTNEFGAPSADEFRAKGPGHTAYDNQLKTYVSEGVMLPEEYMVLRLAFFDVADDVLNSEMFRLRPSANLGGTLGKAIKTAKEYDLPAGIRLERGLAYMHQKEAWRTAANQAFVQPQSQSLILFHEYGHAGYSALLSKQQRKIVDRVYKEMKASGELDTYFQSTIYLDSAHYASNPREFFAQAFAEYVIRNRVPHQKFVDMFKQLSRKLADTIARILRKDNGGKLKDLDPMFEQILKGEASSQSKFSAVNDLNDYIHFRGDRRGSAKNIKTRLRQLFEVDLPEEAVLEALEQTTEDGFRMALTKRINEYLTKSHAANIPDEDLDDAFAMARGGDKKKGETPRDKAKRSKKELEKSLAEGTDPIDPKDLVPSSVREVAKGLARGKMPELSRKDKLTVAQERYALMEKGVDYILDRSRLNKDIANVSKNIGRNVLKVKETVDKQVEVKAEYAAKLKKTKNAEEKARLAEIRDEKLQKLEDKLTDIDIKLESDRKLHKKLRDAAEHIKNIEKTGFIPPARPVNIPKSVPDDVLLARIPKDLADNIMDPDSIDKITKLITTGKNTPAIVRKGQRVLIKSIKRAQKEVAETRAKRKEYLESQKKQISAVREYYKDKEKALRDGKLTAAQLSEDIQKEFGLKYTDLPHVGIKRIINGIAKATTKKEILKLLAQVADIYKEAITKKLAGEIKKMITDVDSIPPHFADRIDAIIDSYGGVKFHTPSKDVNEKLRKLADFLEEHPDEIYKFKSPKTIKELKQLEKLDKKDITKGSVDDVLNLYKELAKVYDEGKLAWKAYYGHQVKGEKIPGIFELRAMNELEEIRAIGVFNMDVDSLPAKYKDTAVEKTLKSIQTGNMHYASADRVFDSLDNFNYDGALRALIKQPLDDAITKAEIDYAEKMVSFQKMEEYIKDKYGVTLTDKNYERIGIHAYTRQIGAEAKMLKAGVPQKDIDAARTLEKHEKEMYEFMRGQLDSMYPSIDAVFRTEQLGRLTKIDNYFPISNRLYDDRAITTVAIKDNTFRPGWDNADTRSVMMDEYVHKQKDIKHEFTKERHTLTGKVEMRLNARNIYQKHMKDATYYVNVEHDTQRVANLLKLDETKKLLGDTAVDWLEGWLDAAVARRGMPAGFRFSGWDVLRRNVGVSTLGFNPSPILKQPLALAAGTAEVGELSMVRALADISANRKVLNRVNDYSAQMFMRNLDDPAFADLSFEGKMTKFQESAYAGIKYVDGKTANTVWYAAYKKEFERLGGNFDTDSFMDGSLINSKHHEAARKYADYVARKTQGSSKAKDIPMMYNSAESKRTASWLFQFRSFVLNQSQQITHDSLYWALRNARGKTAKHAAIGQVALKNLRTFGWIFAGVAAEDAITVVLTSLYGSKDFEEQLKDRTLMEKAVDITGAAITPLGYGIDFATMEGRTGIPAIDTIMMLGEAIKSAGTESQKSRVKGFERSIEAALKLAGVPGAGFVGTVSRGQAIGLDAIYETPAEEIAAALRGGDKSDIEYLIRKYQDKYDINAIADKAVRIYETELKKERKNDVEKVLRELSASDNRTEFTDTLRRVVQEEALDDMGIKMLESEINTRIRNELIGEGWTKKERIDIKSLIEN